MLRAHGIGAVVLFTIAGALSCAPDARSELGPSPAVAALTAAATVAAPTTAGSTGAATQDPPPHAIPAGYRVSVARLRIDLPIAEGDVKRDVEDQHTPENFAFHLPGSAIPGAGGNTYLYAHARQGMFLALWNARQGDEVLITAPDGRVLVYVVREIEPRVAPTDVSSTTPTLSERLTLQTSTGPQPSDPRFVVIAFPRD